MMDELEKRVIAFVASERGAKPEKISVDSRLQDDLGLDGDDAVALFKSFEREFSADCSSLWGNWDKRFGPEAGPHPVFILACLVIFAAGIALGSLIPGIPKWWWGILFVGIWIWPLKCWPMRGRHLEPITIRMMVDAARAKRWP